MDMNSPLVKEASTSFSMFNLWMSKGFNSFIPFMLKETGRQYPRSIANILRDAFYKGVRGRIKGWGDMTLTVIDPEIMSEDPALYKEAQTMAQAAQLLYSTDDYTFRSDDKFLYAINRGTNLPLMLSLN